MILTDRQPTGLRKGLLRAPIWLYRMHPGAVLGYRLVSLAHRGRRSGQRGEVMLEVVKYIPHPEEIIVAAGWADRADWYRNLRVAPPVHIVSGSRRWADPDQRFLDAAETSALHMNYQQAHPRAWRRLAWTVGLPIVPNDQDWTAVASRVPAVAFTPQQLIG
ncbi:MAG: nitroreductase family deazaflavin-dependent oxidoreductase [Nakamurella sp.]